MNMNRIYLIGYMGCGKTTVGKRLAIEANMQFVDLDLFIENRYRKPLSSIFTERGEAEFREIEHKALEEVSQFENVVISTGGGTPCFLNNIQLMNETGLTIYLKTSVDKLLKRLIGGRNKRPLIQDKNKEELESFISSNLQEREPIYMQASYVYNPVSLETQEDVLLIVNTIKSYLSNYQQA